MADMAAARDGYPLTVRLAGRPRGEEQKGRAACVIRGVAAGQCGAGGLRAGSRTGCGS